MPESARFTKVRAALARVGIPRDGVLMMHSAFKTCGQEGYDPYETLGALVDYMAQGTLMLPAMSWRYVNCANPVFDELKTPSNTGILSEIFRTEYATYRSIHPTHSVCGCGAKAETLLNGHHQDETPCSSRSPFGRLVSNDGWIVMFGVGVDCCTLIHHVEEIVAIDVYLRPADQLKTYLCRKRDGQELSVNVRHHIFLSRDFWQFQDILAVQGKLHVTMLGNTVIRAFRARDMAQVVEYALRERPDAIIARPGQRYRMM